MIDINWNNFKAKFNERETKAFERLAYLLFCSEFGVKVGIFRFKNQTGIETEPIKLNNETIGFQSKFYDTKIVGNKDDIIDSISKAKRENSALTKIILYTNQEISESNKKGVKKPQYLVDIENAAQKIRIKLEWRVPSHFDVQLALPVNERIAEYFFSLGKNLIDFISEIKAHTENILHAIQSDIDLNGTKIKIERDSLIERLNKVDNPVAIIAGEGGSGKTAIIKDLFDKDERPIYVFKAAEFNISHIADLFKRFGAYNLSDFISEHENETEKVMVIDSAEKLADLENQDAFKEFLSVLIKNKWKVFFTTRYSYLDDLTFQLLEVYRLHLDVVRVKNLEFDELREIAKTYDFILPANEKLLKLITNLFYLNEFLSQYQNFDTKTDLAKFKAVLWQKKIQNSSYKKDNTHLEREKCFVQLAMIRCETGHFYINADHLSSNVLALLSSDEIIKYEDTQAGYFITHDIYEEWALDRIIEREYNSLTTYDGFFENIGTSLPIRRAFRHWLSEKLNDSIDSIKRFIESVFTATAIPSFWKDELLISVLLSEYSQDFFVVFEKLLLADNKARLKKIIFLLRTACKEVDKMFYQNSEILNEVSFDTAYLITQPKGKGWEYCIVFLYKHISDIDIGELSLMLALMDEWTSFSKAGEATRYAALFALHFYQESKKDREIYYHEKIEKMFLPIFLSGTAEIKDDLIAVIDELMTSDLNDRRRSNDDLLESILTVENNAVTFILQLPEQVLRLADRFWYQQPKDRHPMDFGGYGTERYYSIPSRWHHDYFPASAYQTPIYWALQSSFEKTLRFILDFTNRAVSDYAASGFDDTVMEIDVIIDDQTTTKQYISAGIWSIYRGNGSPVSPYLLQSYHMALEKYLLKICEWANVEVMYKWLLYLLMNTQSASITAVVTSVVLAFQDKFFDIAVILFKNYEFLKHDNWRLMGEHQAAGLYRIGTGMSAKNKLHETDRLATLKQPHRTTSLEYRALEYQFFRNQDVSDEEAESRLDTMYTIIDYHYEKIKNLENDQEETLNYRLMLSRIDRRKMSPKVERKDDSLIIDFNPEVDDKLKRHSEEALKESSNLMRYTSLKLWGTNKFEGERNNYGPYPQYDENAAHVMQGLRTLVDTLNKGGDSEFQLFNHSTPAFACYALIKEHSETLSADDLHFCRDVVISYATAHLAQPYDYQISDGVEVAINALPYLYELYPDDCDYYDMILLLTLFDKYPIGEYKRVCDYAIETINNNLYKIAPERANRLFQGYFFFAERFMAVEQSTLSAARSSMHRYARSEVVEKFATDHDAELGAFFANTLSFDGLNIEVIKVEILESTFNLVPTDTKNQVHLDFVSNALPILCEKLLKEDDRDEEPQNIDFKMRHRFFERVAHFLLQRDIATVHEWIKPFVDAINISSESADFLQALISAEDALRSYEPFWIIWDSFYETIKGLTVGRNRYLNSLIHNYLLAWPYWKKTAKDWFSLKEREKMFFSKVCHEMGSHPAVLYGISKFLNEIGTVFLNDGIIWISDMLTTHTKIQTAEQETNTIYYVEILVRKYVYLNRTRIKTDRYTKAKVLAVLEFLINRASVNAYLLREDVL